MTQKHDDEPDPALCATLFTDFTDLPTLAQQHGVSLPRFVAQGEVAGLWAELGRCIDATEQHAHLQMCRLRLAAATNLLRLGSADVAPEVARRACANLLSANFATGRPARASAAGDDEPDPALAAALQQLHQIESAMNPAPPEDAVATSRTDADADACADSTQADGVEDA